MHNSLKSLLSAALLGGMALPAAAEDAKKITYADQIQPLFRQRCGNCHNPDKKSGGLDLTSYSAMMQGGSSGEVILPGDAGTSYLYMLVTHESEPKMPPNSEKMEVASLDLIKAWIDGGALETSSSKAVIKKPKVDLALGSAAIGKPENPAMPARMGLEPVIHTARPNAVSALATSPWSPLVAVSGQKQIALYNTKTLELLGILPFPEGIAQVLKFSRNGDLLLAGGGHDSYQGKVVVFDVKTGKRVVEVGDELDTVLAADISSDQSLIALGGPSKMLRVYSVATGELVYQVKKHTDWIYALEFSPDSVLLASGDRSGGLHVWEAQTGREYLTLLGHTNAVNTLSWRLDSNILASGSEDATVRLWEMENGGQVKNWGAHGGGVASLEFARDGQLVSCGRDKVVKMWDQNGANTKSFAAFNDLALRVTICDESNVVIGGDWSGEIRVWNVADAAQVGTLSSNPIMLVSRLEAAKAELAKITPEQEKLVAAAAAAQAVVQNIEKEMAAATATVTAEQQKAATATQTIATTQQTVAAVTAEYQAAEKMEADLNKIVPPVTQSVAQIDAAVKLAPADQELVALHKQLADALTKRQQQLTAATAAKGEKAKALETANVQLKTATEQKTAAEAAVAAAQAKLAQLTPTLAPAQAAAKAATDAANAGAQKLQSAQAAVKRWESEIDFSNKLVDLKNWQDKFAVAQTEAETAQAAVDKAKQELATAQAALKSAQEKNASMDTAVKQAQAAVVAAEEQLKAVQTKLTQLEQLLPVLKELVAKAEAASAIVNDADIQATVAANKTLLTKKEEDLKTSQTQLTQLQQTVTTAKTQLTAMQQTAAEAQKQVVAATTDVTARTTVVQTVEQQSAKVQESLKAVTDSLTKAEQEVQKVQESASLSEFQNTQTAAK